jgi:hypothetical protein
MKTAVQYLVKEFSDILGKLETNPMQDLLVDAIKKAKELEKRQIINAYDQDLYGGLHGHRKFENGAEYYSKTFNEAVS